MGGGGGGRPYIDPPGGWCLVALVEELVAQLVRLEGLGWQAWQQPVQGADASLGGAGGRHQHSPPPGRPGLPCHLPNETISALPSSGPRGRPSDLIREMKLCWSLSCTIFSLFGIIYPRLDDKVLGAPNIAYLKDSLINFS